MTTAAAFDRGASRYDLLVGLNPGYHRELRNAAEALVNRIGHHPGLRLIDLACGTGASTKALHRAAPHGTEVLGLDASHGMLAEAGRATWPRTVRFGHAVAGELDLEALGPGTHHGILTCYLYRNVPAALRDKAVAEVFHLLAPGGWLVVQEYSVAGDAKARLIWDAVCRAVIIPLGVLLDRNHDLYHYLWRSVIDFDSVPEFADRLLGAGFEDVAHRTATGWQQGILHTFVARKPRENP
ncbi:MAG TPA: class I SAM-dependent methyltransferase [Propionibacteriaceae bacterium]